MTNKFKAGDRVRIIDNSHCSAIAALGDTGTVCDPAYEIEYSSHYKYKWLMIKLDKEKSPRGWMESRWEHAAGNMMPDTRDYLNVLSAAQFDR